jgi:hypothetical protein
MLAIDHVLNEALQAGGLAQVRAKARLSPEHGIVVDLAGPASAREAALELVELYPVKANWAEAEAAAA